MGNTVALEFAGDATKLQRAAKESTKAVEDVAKAAKDSGADLSAAAKESATFTDRIGKLGAGVSGMTDAFDSAGAAVQGLADLQSAGVERAQRLARAANDVRQATEDMAQATRDGAQAAIDADQAEVDLEQARLDQATALKDYNEAVKEHGKNSAEARQAQIDLKQAGVDVKQAQEDAAQAIRDGQQASIDAEAATLDLAEAQREAKPPELQEWADKIQMVTPLLSGLVGIVGLVTAAQWAWNAATLGSPVTWIVLGIAAIVAGIVLLVKNWDTVKAAGAKAWNWIKDAASSAWNFLKKIPGWIATAFSGIAKFISAPYRKAFNLISDAWNNTIGRLSWTVPGWVPGIGGNTISVPNLPKFHSGGTVPGPPGSEMLAVLQGGEEVVPRGGDGGGTVHVTVMLNREVLINGLAKGVRRRGGNAQFTLGGVNA